MMISPYFYRLPLVPLDVITLVPDLLQTTTLSVTLDSLLMEVMVLSTCSQHYIYLICQRDLNPQGPNLPAKLEPSRDYELSGRYGLKAQENFWV